MPKKAPKMSEADIATLSDWVKMGAPWPKTARSDPRRGQADHRRHAEVVVVRAAEGLPGSGHQGSGAEVVGIRLTSTTIVLAKLEEKGLMPAPMADKRTLIRRATLDLTGLPPTPEEIADFEKDNSSPDAFAKVVDRLLASPAYGERWGRHWLDVARYGDDDIRGLDPRGRGYMPFDGAWVYRDWVIKAVNDDVTLRQVRQDAARRRSAVEEADARRPEGHRLPRRSAVDLGPGRADPGPRRRTQ